VDTFLAHDLPAAPVLRIEDLSHDAQLLARGFLTPLAGAHAGAVLPAGAVATALDRPPLGAAPAPGEHNSLVYGALGYDQAELAALAAAGAI
jgi:formyl-CoA transferase